MEFSPWPYFAEDEIDAAMETLKSGRVNYWTGEAGKEFERKFAQAHGCEYGVALANGTVALELALIALGVGEGDEVLVTPRSFFASVSAVVRVGATPVFVDVDPDSQAMRVDSMADSINENTKAAIVVHLGGWPADMEAIAELCKGRDVKIIEDCAQAHGAKISGKSVGSFGDIAAFSFCQDKIMTTAGEGGMVTTNDQSLYKKMWSFKDHGKSYEDVFEKKHPPGFRWLHDSFGTNWRLSEVQSAVGLVQLAKLDSWIQRRNTNSRKLREILSELQSIRVPTPASNICHSFYKFYFFVDQQDAKTQEMRDKLLLELNSVGVPCTVGSCSEIYKEKAFENVKFWKGERLPVAKKLGSSSLMVPVHPTLQDSEIEFMGESIVQAVGKIL